MEPWIRSRVFGLDLLEAMLRRRANTRVWCWLFFSSRRRHTRFDCDWSSDVCSSDLLQLGPASDHQPVDPTRVEAGHRREARRIGIELHDPPAQRLLPDAVAAAGDRKRAEDRKSGV